MRHFEFRGKFIIPGTREIADFGPVKVIAPTPQQASKDLAPALNEKFSKELPYKHSFSPAFALMHLKWSEVTPTAPPPSPKVEVVKSKAKGGKVRTGGIPKATNEDKTTV